MKRARIRKLPLSVTGILATMLAATSSALAQCAMCKNAVAGSPSATKLAESLNFAIIVLLIPPVLIFCGIFFVAYKYRKARGTEFKSPTDEGLRAKHGSSLQKPQPGNGKRETGGALA